jgi:rhodanese-related sulfurtransferase
MRVVNAIVLAGAAALFGAAGVDAWPQLKAKIRREFPRVRQLSTAELAAWLADKSRPQPVLLDVRAQAEFDVSHLAGARRVEPDSDAAKVAAPKDAPFVTYCSVGWRSSALATRLQAAGFANVRNLEGSIFQWANEGRPIENARGPAEKVHPFDKMWGALLDPQRRAELPAAK